MTFTSNTQYREYATNPEITNILIKDREDIS